MRRRKSPLNDLFDVAALLPWWASLGLAIASWVFLSWYAGREIVTDPSAPFDAAPQALWRGLAQVGQFVFPVVLLLGTGANLLKRFRAGKTLDRVGGASESDPLEGISWQYFELLVGELFRRRGYSVIETASGADGGIDLVARRGLGKAQPEPGMQAAPDTADCPICQSRMVRRTARRGANAGQAFWGCSRFPACKGTRGVE